MHDKPHLEQRPCGGIPYGSHSAHAYLLASGLYQCPGGDTKHEAIRPPAVVELAEALRLTREFVGADVLPAVEGWSWYDALRRWAPEHLPADARPKLPCPNWSLQEPHDAHNFASADGLACCPGWGEPDDDPGPQPGEPPTDAQRIRDLEYVIQRAREALGTDQPPCDHTARITALEDALREVLAKFVHPGHPGEPCKQTGWVRTATLDQWHAVLRGEA